MSQSKLSPEQATDKQIKWWMEEYGFFGDFYMEGDNSKDGYLIQKKQTLAERTYYEADGVIRYLCLQPGERVMDCPCGYGRHSIALLEKGIQAVGYDINSVHLNKAIETAAAKNLPHDFRKKNMLEIDDENTYDGIINMFYSFGFFDTDEENFQVLKNFYKALKPGGQFLMHTDVNLPRILEGGYKFVEERDLHSKNSLKIIDEYIPETKRINGKWIINANGGPAIIKDYSVRVYSKEEFESLCFEAGFRVVKAYSDWEGNAYSEKSEDMIIVATK
jgi:SAM-dependent methyltransferase